MNSSGNRHSRVGRRSLAPFSHPNWVERQNAYKQEGFTSDTSVARPNLPDLPHHQYRASAEKVLRASKDRMPTQQ
jgi:hypothetical protein